MMRFFVIPRNRASQKPTSFVWREGLLRELIATVSTRCQKKENSRHFKLPNQSNGIFVFAYLEERFSDI